MPELTATQLARLYDSFRDTEVTFNTQVIAASGLMPADVHLKVAEQHLPCVLYACSLRGARVIADLGDATIASHLRPNSMVSLRLAFRPPGEPAPLAFFVLCRVAGLSDYNPQKPQVQFVALEFTQRPSDTLIGILGSLLEVNTNSVRRKDERIVITPETMRMIGLDSKESCVAIEGAPRRCVVHDLSFGGAKILVTGLHGPREEKKVLLKLARCELQDDMVLDGNIVRVEQVEGRKDVVALSIQFSSDPPISYKQKINGYFAAQSKAR
jgi:hypothetical protein